MDVFHDRALPPIVLASGSPRRRELLLGLGLSFDVSVADIDESARAGEAPERLVARLSAGKVESVAADVPEALVIGADTVVVMGGTILGKPRDESENREFLEVLSGGSHDVYTGHSLRLGGRGADRVACTRVTFRPLSPLEIDRYVTSGDGLDKAGGYGIQGRGAALVSRIEGCYFNVVGMSVATVVELAGQLGVELV
ncbi:MAG: Maf family protein [Trueperaceae bacterium]